MPTQSRTMQLEVARTNRSRKTFYPNEAKNGGRKPTVPVKELLLRRHQPDMAAGVVVPLCQEIKSETATPRKSADPPDADELRFDRRRSSARGSRAGLDPLEEDSCEDTAPDGTGSNRRDRASASRCHPNTPPRNSRNKSTEKGRPLIHSREKYTNYTLDSAGYEQYRRQQEARSNQINHRRQKSSNCDPDRVQPHCVQNEKQSLPKGANNGGKHQQQETQTALVPHGAGIQSHDISDLTFRGLDPPERDHGKKPPKKNALGPQDPPAEESSGSRGRLKKASPRNSSSSTKRAGGVRAKSNSNSSRKNQEVATAKKAKNSQRSSRQKSRPDSKKTARGTSQQKSRSGSRGKSRENSKKETASVSKKKKKKETAQIKSILKKKDAPLPIAFFGGQEASPSSSFGGEKDGESAAKSSKKARSVRSTKSSSDDGTISIDMKSVKSSNSMKSALRRGRYAASVNNLCDSESEGQVGDRDDGSSMSSSLEEVQDEFEFDKSRSHFMRTADLGMTQDTIFAQQFLDDPNSTPQPHYHHPTPHPPPGVQFNIDENWICVDDGNGGHSPIAPQAVDALVSMGYRSACDPVMWTPTGRTRKYMTAKRLAFDDVPMPGPSFEGEGGPDDAGCLLWSGKFARRYHGSEIPVIRSQGVVNMCAEDLVDLLMDSSRVDEYNKASVGRIDEVVLSYGNDMDCPFSGQKKKRLTGVVVQGSKIVDGTAQFMETSEIELGDNRTSSTPSSSSRNSSRKSGAKACSKFVGVTKLVRSTNRLPLIRKRLEFTTLLHCRELLEEQGGNGYIVVGRSITPAEDGAVNKGKGVIRSEILFSVSIIRRLHQVERGKSRGVLVSDSGKTASKKDLRRRCLLITMNHMKSPLIPGLIAKRVGLSAAAKFMADVRAAQGNQG